MNGFPPRRYTADTSIGAHRGPAFTALEAMIGLGSTGGSIMSGILRDHYGFETTFYATMAWAMVGIGFVLVIPGE